MSDENQTDSVAIVQPVITEIKDKPDELAGFMAKFIVAYFVGPKLAPLLISMGITIDPALATIVLAGIIHKAHVFISNRFKVKI